MHLPVYSASQSYLLRNDIRRVKLVRSRNHVTGAAMPYADVSPSRTLRPTEAWCAYFQVNAASCPAIPWEQGVRLTPQEQAAIAASVQGFQLGESSEGRHLLRCAEAYAERTGDRAYVTAIRLFIGEEQRHARDLGRFLRLAGIPLLTRTWPDTVFRWLRHRAGLELSIGVLLTAEIIAKVYYLALRQATGDAVLRRLCDKILDDEVAHVCFQSERLAQLRRERPRWLLAATHGGHRFFFAGTCVVVWWKHRRALRAGGFGWGRFWRAAWRELEAALVLMNPATYADYRYESVDRVPLT